jgi:hypothetical protein
MKADILKEFREKFECDDATCMYCEPMRKVEVFISSVFDRGFEEGKKEGKNNAGYQYPMPTKDCDHSNKYIKLVSMICEMCGLQFIDKKVNKINKKRRKEYGR